MYLKDTLAGHMVVKGALYKIFCALVVLTEVSENNLDDQTERQCIQNVGQEQDNRFNEGKDMHSGF